MTSRPWSQGEDARLMKRWNNGDEVEDIAKDLGRAPSAIRGRACTLRNNGYTVASRAMNGQQMSLKRDGKELKRARAVPPHPDGSRAIPILEIGLLECSWIDDGEGPGGLATCCGHPVGPGSHFKFCAHHMSHATATAKPVEDDEDDVPSEIEQEAA